MGAKLTRKSVGREDKFNIFTKNPWIFVDTTGFYFKTLAQYVYFICIYTYMYIYKEFNPVNL